MAVFSYLYFNSYVAREVGITVGGVLSAAMQLNRCTVPLLVCKFVCPLVACMYPNTLRSSSTHDCSKFMTGTAPHVSRLPFQGQHHSRHETLPVRFRPVGFTRI